MSFFFINLETDLGELARAIDWWRSICLPLGQETGGLWEEWPRIMGVDVSEISFSNPDFTLRSLDQKKCVQIIQSPPPLLGEPPLFYMLISTAFKECDEVNKGSGMLDLHVACPASDLTKEKASALLRAWMVDDKSPTDTLSIARRIQPPCVGYLGIDL